MGQTSARDHDEQIRRDTLAKAIRALRKRKAVYSQKCEALLSCAAENPNMFSYWLDRAEAVRTTAEAHDWAISAVRKVLP